MCSNTVTAKNNGSNYFLCEFLDLPEQQQTQRRQRSQQHNSSYLLAIDNLVWKCTWKKLKNKHGKNELIINIDIEWVELDENESSV